MFNAQCDALSAQLARRVPLTQHNLRAAGCTVLEPRVLTADVQHRLAVYNAATPPTTLVAATRNFRLLLFTSCPSAARLMFFQPERFSTKLEL